MTVKQFSIEYDAINSKNTFTTGDTINGRIVVEVSKQTTIQSLIFIAQGKARVCWHEHYGQDHHHVYWSDETYYDIKQHILRQARQDGTEVISKGRHVFPFSFRIPDRKIPSSFKTSIGKIVHKLKAELKQSLKLTKKAKAHFTFVSQADMNIPGLLEPQYGCKDKAIKVFGSGSVSVDVRTKKMGYMQGEALHLSIEIRNHSTRSVKPKIILYEKRSFFAQGHRKLQTNEIHKEKIEAIASSSDETVTKVLTVPTHLPPSILSCSIIKLEYRLKIYLDIKCASNPEIKLPIVVLPEDSGLTPAVFGVEALRNPNQLTWSNTPQEEASQPVYPPTYYGTHALYPSVTETDSSKTAL
ncbi:Arrestin domain-containing protein 3 [Channa argus]|uniref:Arrestin domain-containing protein 3 n=2 Tax=Channa argus TaxID=215402 RepID=A0A6G1Q0Z6_CHAAH|nr:Arrestin domain-containing protein 3 [Channa argus]